MFLYLGGVWMPHTFVHPLYIIHPHMFPYSSVHLYVLGGFCMLWGVIRGPLLCGTLPLHLPLYGGAFPSVAPPLSCWLPCASVVLGILVCHMGIFSFLWGWGVSHLLVAQRASVHVMSICLFLYIFVVHYVSHFYYGYDYYSSSYGGIFWPVISFISDCGSFPDGVSSKLGSAWSGSTTTLDAQRLWRCY